MECEHKRKRCIDCNEYIESSKPTDLLPHLRHLLAGATFPPNTYTNRKGEAGVWDDRLFFDQMLKLDGNWSQAQDSLIRSRFNYYDQNGQKLKDVKPPAAKESKLDISDSMQNLNNLDEIPF